MATTLRLMPLLKRLIEQNVEFVVIGGVAATVHGSARVTLDLDVCAPLSEENIPRILAALRGIRPTHRMRPDRLPVVDDPARFKGFKNLNIETQLGVIDLLSEVDGVGTYDEVLRHSVLTDIGEVSVRVLDLDSLIAAKQTANRLKDREALAELKVIQRENASGHDEAEPPRLTTDQP